MTNCAIFLFLLKFFSFHFFFPFFFCMIKIDVVGNSMWDYTHQCDHAEMRDILNSCRTESKNTDEPSNNVEKPRFNVLIRMKCTLTSRGRSVNIKSASYKV